MRSTSSCRRARSSTRSIPASVNHYFPTSHVVYTCVLAAFGKFNPARAVAPAGFGTGAIAIGYSKGRAGKPTVQYELMVTSLGGTSTHDGTSIVLADEPFHARHASRDRRDRISGDGAALRYLARLRGRRPLARRHRARARISAPRRLHPYGAHIEPSARRLGPLRRRTAAALAYGDQSGHAAGGGDGLHGDAHGAGGHRAPAGADRRRRLWRAGRAAGELVQEDVENGYVSPEAAVTQYKRGRS